MSSALSAAKRMVAAILRDKSLDEVMAGQAPDAETKLKPWIRQTKRLDASFTAAHWRTLLAQTDADEATMATLYDQQAQGDLETYSNNIENYIGQMRLPVGVIGPLRVRGIFAQDDYYIPLATSEAALVASYGRGARLISAAGGCTTALLAEGVQRAPAFAFDTISQAGAFLGWVLENTDRLVSVAEATTRHGKLCEITPHIDGANVYLACTFTTGDAAGQNMVTIATQALCEEIEASCPITPRYWFVEANFSGDKKASNLSFMGVRGRKATASVELPEALISSHLHTTAKRMEEYWRMSALGGVMSGTIGVQGHLANGLAALYLATGQDAACVSESAVGVTRAERREDENGETLFVSVTMPNIIVGTVGGGTGLPTQSAGLDILGLKGNGKARALAEVIAATGLAGELSIVGALCAHHFARAHQGLARSKS